MAPLTGFRRKLAYGLFFAASFLLALSRTFPAEAVRDRLVLAAAAQGWQIRMDDVGPSGFAGVSADKVRIETRDGVPITLQDVSASVQILPLLLGRQSIAFDVGFLDGRLAGVAEQGKGWQRLACKGKALDLSRSDSLRKAIGVDLGGKLTADIDVTLDEKEPAKSSGHIDLTVEEAMIRGGDMPIPGMGGTLTLPKMALGKLVAKGTVKDGKATMEKLSARSDELDASADGLYFVMQPRLEYATLFGKAKVKVNEAFWSKSGATNLKGVIEMALAQAKGPDGYYGFQIFGSLGHPQARLSP